eukprot:CAMPEP_0178456542 /NCGR_PEP_ID=MMETSP0689_2-20121128/46533_1 /TAXON_ID=160604 /ORGANISM="Amphidinium massartii, Strain CS-259" /LENGTH=126 /DNA_ID=CAMNT_0020082721 /DNA_START=1047 /DNA_END=1423 /DNA_ORIENTATION=+
MDDSHGFAKFATNVHMASAGHIANNAAAVSTTRCERIVKFAAAALTAVYDASAMSAIHSGCVSMAGGKMLAPNARHVPTAELLTPARTAMDALMGVCADSARCVMVALMVVYTASAVYVMVALMVG